MRIIRKHLRSWKHHEGNENFRSSFLNDVTALFHAIPCNPFEETNFVSLHNMAKFHDKIVENLKKMPLTGEEQAKNIHSEKINFTGNSYISNNKVHCVSTPKL